jgi:hypothetical protein
LQQFSGTGCCSGTTAANSDAACNNSRACFYGWLHPTKDATMKKDTMHIAVFRMLQCIHRMMQQQSKKIDLKK